MNAILLIPELLILFFAFIQSLFGIGLLAFGTPTLLLLGYDFHAALTVLLPCSIAVSSCQTVFMRGSISPRLTLRFAAISLPFVVTGVLITTLVSMSEALKLSIGLILVLTAILRFSPTADFKLKKMISRNEKFSIAAIGVVHGISNLGGGLLAVYSRFKIEEVRKRLGFIASIYVLFASVQLLTLASAEKFYYEDANPLLAISCVGISFLTWYYLSNIKHHRLFDMCLSIVLAVYGSILVLMP